MPKPSAKKTSAAPAASSSSSIMDTVKALIAGTLIGLLLIALCWWLSLMCVPHRDPLTQHLDSQHFLIQQQIQQDAKISRQKQQQQQQQGQRKTPQSKFSSLSWTYFASDPDLYNAPIVPTSGAEDEDDSGGSDGPATVAAASLVSSHRSVGAFVTAAFCTHVAERFLLPTLFHADTGGGGDGGVSFVSSFVRAADAFLTRLVSFGSLSTNWDSVLGGASASGGVEKNNNKNDDGEKEIFFCEFARQKKSNIKKSSLLFDFLMSNELREVLLPFSAVPIADKGDDGVPPTFQEFFENNQRNGNNNEAEAMFLYLRALYVHNNGTSSVNANFGSARFLPDTTFLGEFLSGVFVIPSSKRSGKTRIRFAVPRSRVNDGVADCCDGSDENDNQDNNNNNNNNNNNKKKNTCKQQLTAALGHARARAATLERAFQVCRQRSRRDAPRLAHMLKGIAEQAATFEPQWQQLVQAYQQLVPQYQQLYPIVHGDQPPPAGAPPKAKLLKKFNKVAQQLQQVQQQLQQAQHYKAQLEQMQSSATSDAFGRDGQFYSIYEQTVQRGALPVMPHEDQQQDQQQQEQEEVVADPDEEGNNNNNNNNNDFEQKQQEYVVAAVCHNVTVTAKQLAGGSAEPDDKTPPQLLRVCPFRAAEGIEAQRYHDWAADYRRRQRQSETGQKTASKQQEQQPQEKPRENMLGQYFGQYSFWPVNALVGTEALLDVLPQMPSRIAEQKMYRAAVRFHIVRSDQKQMKVVSQQDMMRSQRTQGLDSFWLLSSLYNRSLEGIVNKQKSQDEEKTGEEKEATDYTDPVVISKLIQSKSAEHRYPTGNFSELLRNSGLIVGDVSFFRYGEACWNGPAERTLALTYVCGAVDGIESIREDGKCIYEVVFSTPSACCSSSTGSSSMVDDANEIWQRTRYRQRDNTLVRRYLGVASLLELWM